MMVLKWPSQCRDLNPIEMLWHDLKKKMFMLKHSDVAELNSAALQGGVGQSISRER